MIVENNKMVWLSVGCILFLCTLINGCSKKSLTLSHRYNDKEFYQNHKAVVIVKMVEPIKSILNNSSHEWRAGFRLIKVNSNSFDKDKRESYYISSIGDDFWLMNTDYSHRVAMINPGIYYIDDIRWSDSALKYYSVSQGLSPNGVVVYGAFEVQPGDVAHVGKLLIMDNTILLNKVDDLENVKNDLLKAKKYELYQKVKNVEFYGRGSIVRRDSKGIFTLHKAKYLKE